jgi:death on curing protein
MSEFEPQFLTLEQVILLHERSLAEQGGLAGMREPGLVESALASARNTWLYGRGDVFDIAASYAFHLAEAQAFNDGNKRAAIAAALAFLDMNVECRTPDQKVFYQHMIAIASKALNKDGLAEQFRQLAVLR